MMLSIIPSHDWLLTNQFFILLLHLSPLNTRQHSFLLFIQKQARRGRAKRILTTMAQEIMDVKMVADQKVPDKKGIPWTSSVCWWFFMIATTWDIGKIIHGCIGKRVMTEWLGVGHGSPYAMLAWLVPVFRDGAGLVGCCCSWWRGHYLNIV